MHVVVVGPFLWSLGCFSGIPSKFCASFNNNFRCEFIKRIYIPQGGARTMEKGPIRNQNWFLATNWQSNLHSSCQSHWENPLVKHRCSHTPFLHFLLQICDRWEIAATSPLSKPVISFSSILLLTPSPSVSGVWSYTKIHFLLKSGFFPSSTIFLLMCPLFSTPKSSFSISDYSRGQHL